MNEPLIPDLTRKDTIAAFLTSAVEREFERIWNEKRIFDIEAGIEAQAEFLNALIAAKQVFDANIMAAIRHSLRSA